MEDTLNSAARYSGRLVDRMIEEADSVNSLIQTDVDIQQMLRIRYDTPAAIYQQRQAVNGKLMTLQYNYTKLSDAFYILLDDGRAFKSTNYALLKGAFDGENWYRKLRLSDDVRWMGGYEQSLVANNMKEGYIGVSYPLFNVRTGLSDGIVLVEIRTETLSQIIQSGLAIPYVYAELTDVGGKQVLGVGPDVEGHLRTVSASVDLLNGWKMTFTCDIWNMINQEIASMLIFAVALLAVVIFLSVRIGQRTARSVSDPINNLLEEMNRAGDFNSLSSAHISTNVYEIDSLIVNYNRLIGRIQELFEEIKKRQKEARKSEFAALQAQINPHFLYNTLDNISWLIRTGNDEQALRSLMAFGKFFRLSLSKGASMVCIHNEIRHAELYLDIQKIRFCENFNFSVKNFLQLSDLENNYVPKLVLQPLIENAINHGIENKTRDGYLSVTVERIEDTIVFTVYDNGDGIEEDRLRELNAQLAQPDYIPQDKDAFGYGIFNINLRIKSVFGPDYGLSLASEYGKYTRSIITVPLNPDPKLDVL